MKTVSISAALTSLLVALSPSLAAGTQKIPNDADVYTLYSTNYPQSSNRRGEATFDLNIESYNRVMCENAADLYKTDFEKLKTSSRYDGTTKMRYWCEKGRFRP